MRFVINPGRFKRVGASRQEVEDALAEYLADGGEIVQLEDEVDHGHYEGREVKLAGGTQYYAAAVLWADVIVHDVKTSRSDRHRGSTGKLTRGMEY